MMNILRKGYKVYQFATRFCRFVWATHCARLVFRLNGIHNGKGLRAVGVPAVNVSLGGRVEIGRHFTIRTGLHDTEVGSVGSRIRVGPNGFLKIGNYVGMSNATIVCDEFIEIGDHVFIGGGAQIFDTNFHSTNASVRTSGRESRQDVRKAPIRIGDRVFIGTNVIVCKGVSIGPDAIVAAGAVVVRDIPAGETWGGNPARRLS